MNKWTDLPTYLKVILAESTTVHTSILEELSKDEDWLVRWEIARNPNTPSETLYHLIKDKSYMVRDQICKNPSTPIKILQLLLKDIDPYTASFAKKNLQDKLNSDKINT